MADVNRGNRPLSPHLQIYRLPLAGITSILNRITGVGMTLAAILIVWWFAAGAFSAAYFEFVDGLLTSILGHLILIGSLAALWYHMLNSMRHLIWDTGRMMDIESVEKSSYVVFAGTAVLTLLTIIIV
ncbi:MAG: succinate dehydrogenase, cytochrome b556 subunit [Roseinatronobacter sp.]|jgi:succinate dehydrogenase / fumarate reductase cytochrome b subunit|uniref:Succinate dehydrogenase cytochrome b556 subunit n=1 Tax=Roseinatronobacter monicus TaxID=393481 RepID=A0A543KEM4_9RHOB|nr:succinate dehydrogenase, cytochrome b556 subunit [Roseinatronobacter monicus]TQM93533.1 succinate dehydrogenase subunit C [Roseinatronobacter monicus]TVQ03140.1 MAG: succinate dehydrogenase, cytochrome b556 subunit [Roseinatronobacter sp.]